jgi:hypothetical protein
MLKNRKRSLALEERNLHELVCQLGDKIAEYARRGASEKEKEYYLRTLKRKIIHTSQRIEGLKEELKVESAPRE